MLLLLLHLIVAGCKQAITSVRRLSKAFKSERIKALNINIIFSKFIGYVSFLSIFANEHATIS